MEKIKIDWITIAYWVIFAIVVGGIIYTEFYYDREPDDQADNMIEICVAWGEGLNRTPIDKDMYRVRIIDDTFYMEECLMTTWIESR